MRFRTRSREIDAVQFTGTRDSQKAVSMFLSGGASWMSDPLEGGSLSTPEGVRAFIPGDWIVYDASGQYHVCRQDDFNATYEPVSTVTRHRLQPGP